MTKTQRTNPVLIAAAAFLAAAIFLVDLSLPLGVAGEVLYVALVLIGWWFHRRSDIFVLAAVSSALTAAGYLFSPEGGFPWMVLTNRALAFFTIWVTAVLLFTAKRAEDVLRASEERYRRVYENTPVMLHSIDRDGRLLSVSDYWLEVLGYEREEVIGHKAYEFCSEESRREANEKHLPEFFRTGFSKDISYQFVKKNGDVMDVLLSAIMVRDEQGDFFRSLAVMIDVTERKRAEERFRSYFDLPLVGSAIYAADKRWIEVNDKLCDLFGYTRDELMALTWVDITHPDDMAENLRLFDRASSGKGGDVYTLDKRFIRKNGETLHASVSAQCVRRPDGAPDYFILLVQDFTERKRAERALVESEERLRLVTNALPVLISYVGRDGRYRFVNKAYEDWFGIPCEQLLGMHLRDLVGDDTYQGVRKRVEEALSGRTVQFEANLPIQCGGGRHVQAVCVPHFVENGAVDGFFALVTDVTEQKEAQAQLIRASRLATLGEMASGIAHEINQPLTNMRMMAENALAYIESGDVDAAVQTRKLEGVIGQVDRMARIVDHMRLFSRKDSTERESFSPTAGAADAIGMVENQYRALGIRLERNLPARCRNVSGHRFKLEQVLLNLLSNACDAAAARADREAREGRDYVPEVSVRVAEDRETDTVILSVSDNGGGVPGDVLDEIFDPFFTTKAEGHGTGLGLSISYSIIDTMGGRIEVQNVAGGARFDIILPVADEAQPRLPAPKPQEQPAAADRRGRLVRVLVVATRNRRPGTRPNFWSTPGTTPPPPATAPRR